VSAENSVFLAGPLGKIITILCCQMTLEDWILKLAIERIKSLSRAMRIGPS